MAPAGGALRRPWGARRGWGGPPLCRRRRRCHHRHTPPARPHTVVTPARLPQVLSGTSFEEADMTNTDFTEAYLGDFDQRKLCKNPTLKGENPKTGQPTRESAGCAPAT